MKAFAIITCLLVGAVIGSLADSEELSPELLDCLKELDGLYTEEIKNYEKCMKEYPRPPVNSNEDGIYMTLDPNQEARRQCHNEFHTPEIRAKWNEVEKRYMDLVRDIPDSLRDKIKKLMDEWSRG